MRAFRLLTGADDAAFCHRVSAALSQGWELHGSPAYAHDPETGTMRCAQAVTKQRDDVEYDPSLKLGDL